MWDWLKTEAEYLRRAQRARLRSVIRERDRSRKEAAVAEVLAWTIDEGSWTAHDRALAVTVTISEKESGYGLEFSMGDAGDPYHIELPGVYKDFVQAERAAMAQLREWSEDELAMTLETRDDDVVAGDDGGE